MGEDLNSGKSSKKQKSKGKKSKKEGEQDGEDDYDEKKSKKKRGKSPKNKGKRSKRGNEGEIKKLVVVQSSSGTEASIIKLLNTSFKISDRVLLVTECGDLFVAQDNNEFILCDGCLCDYNALRQINLAELDSSKRIDTIENVVNRIIDLKKSKKLTMGSRLSQQSNDDIVRYGNQMNASFWELMEGMIDLKNLTNKFDEIKNEII